MSTKILWRPVIGEVVPGSDSYVLEALHARWGPFPFTLDYADIPCLRSCIEENRNLELPCARLIEAIEKHKHVQVYAVH